MRHGRWAIPALSLAQSVQSSGFALVSAHLRRAARGGSVLAVASALATLAAACARGPAPNAQPAPVAAPACSWYGDTDDGTLYFGESGFWSGMRSAGGDPNGELRAPSQQVVGRFDLAHESMLPPLPTAATSARPGTWDVLVHPNGRVYYTSFFDSAGSIDRATGDAKQFDAAGTGLNELALLPDGRVLATRYGAHQGGDGSLVELDANGVVVAEHPLAPTPGATVAPKSLAYDPVRHTVWVNTDLVTPDPNATHHDARIVDLATGRELARFDEPELQFPQFGPDGRGWFAWLDGRRLVLQITEPGEATGPSAGRALLLDPDFGAGLDFVQDIRVMRDGRVVLTRWSGRVHVVDSGDRVRTVDLPRPPEHGLYYTAVTHGDRVCATLCAGVRVVCASLP
jgi:hypothetical protein